ncbi:MAG: hypothetical protein NC311_05265 [Muribaculaceae bacterium]|nr:hypothetical protein [Muribaculaceae bacterium]
MKLNDVIKNIRGVRVSTDAKILFVGLLLIVGIDRGCSGHKDVDTTEIDQEIVDAQVALRAANARFTESAAVRDVYKHKCDSLCPVVGVRENPDERARKNTQWRQYRDSLSKYGDRAIEMEIARDWAKLRVDTLVSKRDRMKLR